MDDRLRVLSIVYDLNRGGHENRLLSIGRHIDRARFDYGVLSLTRPIAETRPEFADTCLWNAFAGIGIPVSSLSEEFDADPHQPGLKRLLRSAPRVARMVRRLCRTLRERRIDVIDAHQTTAMFVSTLAARLTGIPVFQSSYHVRNWSSPVMRVPGQVTLGLAGAIVTDSQMRADEITGWLWRKRPVHVIQTGLEVPRPERTPAEVRQILGLPPAAGRRTVGFVGGITPLKGQMQLVEAAGRVVEQYPDTEFLCVGFWRDGTDYLSRLQHRIEELGLRDRFFIQSYPHAIGDVVQLFDIQAHPSLLDSLPLVIVEGMASGRPIVASAIGGIPEVISNGTSGRLVPPGDVEQLAAGIIHLLANPFEAGQMGAAARRFYHEHLTPAVMTRRIESLYTQLAGRAVTSSGAVVDEQAAPAVRRA